MGLRASPTVQLIFDDMRVPAANLLGDEGQGFIYAMQSLDNGRLGIAAQAIGIARAALEHSAALRRRAAAVRQADQGVPGDPVQARRHGDARRASRALLHAAAAAKDRGEPITQFSSMSKLIASETAMWVTTRRSRSSADTAT